MFLEVVVKVINVTSFSKHQIGSATHLDLKTSYPKVSIRKYCINIKATFAIMSTLATIATDKPLRYCDRDASY